MLKTSYNFIVSSRGQAVEAISSITLSLGLEDMQTSRSPFMLSVNGQWGCGKSLWWDEIRSTIPGHDFQLLRHLTTRRICEVWADNSMSTHFICASLSSGLIKMPLHHDSKREALQALRQFILDKDAKHKFKAKRKIYVLSQGPLSGTDMNVWFNTVTGEDWPEEDDWRRKVTVKLTSDRVENAPRVHRNLERLEANFRLNNS